jgi:TetR/AcrR family transcriptional regulator, regulator of cefoperazone and chloramphenicol sensitivity
MPKTKKPSAPATKRAQRPDGAATRAHLLEIAGQVFAERGFAGATSKDICERAGTPMASVNYHFGSREALYEAVLIEAHRQVVGLDELIALTQGLTQPTQKLGAVLTHLIGLSTLPSTPWGFRVMLREVTSPSPAIPALVETAIRPKAALLLGIIGEVLGLPPAHPAVQRALLFSVLPCIAIVVAPKEMPARLLPDIAKNNEGPAADFVRYVVAGLEAMAGAYHPDAGPR